MLDGTGARADRPVVEMCHEQPLRTREQMMEGWAFRDNSMFLSKVARLRAASGGFGAEAHKEIPPARTRGCFRQRGRCRSNGGEPPTAMNSTPSANARNVTQDGLTGYIPIITEVFVSLLVQRLTRVARATLFLSWNLDYRLVLAAIGHRQPRPSSVSPRPSPKADPHQSARHPS